MYLLYYYNGILGSGKNPPFGSLALVCGAQWGHELLREEDSLASKS